MITWSLPRKLEKSCNTSVRITEKCQTQFAFIHRRFIREDSSRLLIFIRVWSMTHSTLVSPQQKQNFFNLPNNGLPRTWRLSVEAYGQCFVAVSEKQSLQILVNLPFTNIKALFVPFASSSRGCWQRHCGWGKNI